MPNNLMDLFGGNDQQSSYGGGLNNMSNSLIGLGMGLLTPYNAWKGESPYANALQGFQTGSVVDQRRQQQQQELALQRERMQLARETANREPESIRQLRAAGVPQEKWADYLYPKQDALTEGKITYREQEYPYLRDRSGTYTWPLGRPPGGPGSLQAQPAAPAGNTVVPGTTLYWPGQQQQTAAAVPPATTGAGGAATAASAPPKPPGWDDMLPSAQKAYETKRAQLEAEKQTHGTLSPGEEQAAKVNAANTLAALDQADTLATNQGGLFPTTGIVGGALKQVYQPSKDLDAVLNTIKANVSLDKLTAMRQASKTGASGLGAVTESEHTLLQASIAALEQSQSPQQFKANLARVRATYDWIINRIDPNQPPPFSLVGRPGAATTGGGGPAGGGTSPPVGTVSKGYRFKGGDPSQQSNWEAVQ